jgi:hypothetical protein
MSLTDLVKYVDSGISSSSIAIQNKITVDDIFRITNNAYLLDCIELDQLLYCLLPDDISDKLNTYDMYNREHVILDKVRLAKEKNNILQILADNNDQFKNINKKKLTQMVNIDQYNHEFIMLCSIIYNINIFIYHSEMNLFKLYYPDEALYTGRNSIFIQYSSKKVFQRMTIDKKNILTWDTISEFILDNKTLMYPIGINESKIFKIEKRDSKDIPMWQMVERPIYDRNLSMTIFRNSKMNNMHE